MSERSHKKGEIYQRDVKRWLGHTSFLGFETDLFGDAYDVTKKACTIGARVFDFSLRMGRGDLTQHILYCECKYREERTGNVNADFKKFLKRVYKALSAAKADDADSALFAFVSNIPLDDWRVFLANRLRYCKGLDWEPNERSDEELLARACSNCLRPGAKRLDCGPVRMEQHGIESGARAVRRLGRRVWTGISR